MDLDATQAALVVVDLMPRIVARDLGSHRGDDVVMAGLATTMGVESTARAAANHGFEVVFAADAMSGMTAAEHEHALTVVLPRFGDVVDSERLLAALRPGTDQAVYPRASTNTPSTT